MTKSDDEILTVADLARLFGCDVETAAARLINGDLPGLKLGRGWIIPKKALFDRLNEKAQEESAARRVDNSVQSTIKAAKKQKLAIRSTSAISDTLVTRRRGRPRRQPPPLPELD